MRRVVVVRFAFAFAIAIALAPALAFAPGAHAAEFPVAFRSSLGFGPGGGSDQGIRAVGPFGMIAAEIAFRRAPGTAVVLAYETAGGPFGVLYFPEASHEELEHASVLLGIRRHPAKAAVAPFLMLGAGAGRIRSTYARHVFTPDAYSVESGGDETYGIALSGAAGILIIPPPGPLGFTVEVRSSNVFADGAKSHAVAAMFGLTIHPRSRAGGDDRAAASLSPARAR